VNKRIRKLGIARLAGWIVIGLFIVAAVFADFLAPYDYREQSRNEPSAPPSRLRQGFLRR
jgi:ABC-type antimicrobial peptide transport system permease subunit